MCHGDLNTIFFKCHLTDQLLSADFHPRAVAVEQFFLLPEVVFNSGWRITVSLLRGAIT